MQYSSVDGDISQSFFVCANPLNRSGRPCYSRRCSCINCRNKATWKEYVILVRSLERLPATHFLSLNFPWHYTGHGITKKMNAFFAKLQKRIGCKVVFHWRYDGQVQGRFPHVHVLVRASGEIPSEAVYASWVEVWPGDEIEASDTHVRVCDADYVETARYFCKHNETTKCVPKTAWCGQLSGGSRKFFVASKKTLFKDSHYRVAEAREELRAYSELLERFEAEYGNRWVAVTPAEAHVIEGKIQVKGGDSSLCVFTLLPLSVLLRTPLVHLPPRAEAGTLLYSIWPIPPPECCVSGKER